LFSALTLLMVLVAILLQMADAPMLEMLLKRLGAVLTL